MAERIPQSVSKTIVFMAYSSSDHITPATGKTIAITVSKNTGSFANPHAGATNATEISSGWYYVALDSTDTGVPGPLLVHGAVSGIDDVNLSFEVVSAHNAGFDGIPNAAANASGGVLTFGTSTGQLNPSGGKIPATLASSDVTGNVSSNVAQWSGTNVATPDTAGYPKVTHKVGTGTGEINLSSGKVPATLASTDVTGNVAADLQTIKTQTVTCSGGVTVPAATLASTTNITAGTITTATNLTNAPTSGDFTSTMKTSITTAATAATPTAAAVTGAVGSVTGSVGGNVTGSVGSVASAVTVGTMNSGVINNAAFAADTWLGSLQSGTASGGASNATSLANGAVNADNFYNGKWLVITGGTGIGQSRLISAYTGSTRLATVVPNWVTAPDNTSTYAIVPSGRVDVGLILGSASQGAAGYVGVDWSKVTNPTSTVGLSGTTVGVATSVTNGVTVSTNNDKTGYSLTQSFPTNFASLAITGGGAVTAGTVSDKTGYSLTQSFPSNFASMSITAGGVVQSDLQTIKTQSVTCSGGVTFPAATIASAGAQMDLVNAPNATAITAIQSGLATSSALTSVQNHGDSTWATATGFATSAALTTLSNTVGVAGAGLTSVGLASTGLDAVTATPPTGSPSGWNFRQKLTWLIQRFLGKSVYDISGETIKVYADDGTTVVTTQTLTVSDTQQSQGHA